MLPLVLMLATFFGAKNAYATEVVNLSLNETVRQAELIVQGTVTGKQSRWGDASHRWIVTDYMIAVEDVIHSPAAPGSIGKTLQVTYWGGEVDGEGQGVSGTRLPEVKERLLLMLKPKWQTEVNFSPVVGHNQGLFKVTDKTTAGTAATVQDDTGVPLAKLENGSVVKRKPGMNIPATASTVDLETFVAWLKSNKAAIKAGPTELRPDTNRNDPRVIKTFELPTEATSGSKPGSTGTTRAPIQEIPSPRPTQQAHSDSSPSGADSGNALAERLSLLPGEEQDGSAYSFPRTATPFIAVNNFPDSFAPWSPEDEYQMAKWNHYSDVFRVYATPTGNWAWQNNRFDLAGWPSSATMVAQFGAGWDANTIAICYTRWFTSDNIIIEGDIALNPAFSFTLDDEWVYDGGSAQGFRQVMTHELGHMWGLSHQFNFMSVMNYMPSEFRFFGMPYMDDAEAIRAGYPGQAQAWSDLGVYLYYGSGYQSITDATYPSSVTVGETLTVNDYHIENVGTATIGTPTIQWYLTSARNYSSTYYYLGTSTYGALNRFTYFTPSSAARSFTVPNVDQGYYYLNAYIPGDSGAGQGSFPFSNDYAFSRFRIYVVVPTVTVQATDASAAEPSNSGTFTFTRTGGTGAALTVGVSVSGTATSGSDYTSIGTSVTFSAGSSTVTKNVAVINDSLVEANETVVVSLTAGTGYFVGFPSSATVTIQSDDLPVVKVTASDAIAAEPSSTGTFKFTRTGPTTSGLTVNFAVGGTATSGSDFTSLGTTVSFAAGSATATKTLTPLGDALVEGNETVVLTLAAGSGYSVGSPSTATVTIQDANSGASEVIVDDADSAPSMTYVGSWGVSSSKPGYYGTGYHHDANTAKGSKTATFTPNLAAAGDYNVYIRYTAYSDRANNVPVDIVHTGGTSTHTVNQQVNGGTWNLLGTYHFNAGSTGLLRIRTTGTSGFVIADAVKFTPVTPLEVIVDDANSAPSMAYVGTWGVSSSKPGYYGTGYHHDANTAKGSKTATFTPNLPVAGDYNVYIRYTAYSDRANNVPVDVVHTGGTTSHTVNQQLNGGTWNLLGTYHFNAGSGGLLRIRTTGTSGFVIADAVKFAIGGSAIAQSVTFAEIQGEE